MLYSKFEMFLGDWGPKLKEFIEGKEMDKIYSKLKEESKAGIRILPDSINTYRAFKECPFSSLKVVMVLQDPYPTLWKKQVIADGLALSCGNTDRLQPSLINLYDAIEEDCFNGLNLKYSKEQSLEYLAHQGVLLLNSALTVRMGDKNSHQALWRPFMKYLVEEILNKYSFGLVFILMGAEAQELEEYIAPWQHYVLKCEHPVKCSYHGRKMKHDNIFSKTNQILKDIGGEEHQINWLKTLEP